eukprot:TRINITY_DN368_c0_g1_i4.p1 TRINITY_DN368_c0_g1~~TRINITY_DN368_c0_g1_i4.p1  ORF type:complete len:539 (+),score=130.02 TRINITY_DN368_c0_g1_i4:141-1757(+)
MTVSQTLRLLIWIGKECGVSEGYEDYKYLYWGNLQFESLVVGQEVSFFKRTVCVKACPVWKEGEPAPKIDCKPNGYFKTCDTTLDRKESKKILTYNSSPLGDVLCQGIGIDMPVAAVSGGIDSIRDSLIRGVTNNVPKLAACIFLSVLIGIVVMLLIRFCAGPIIWALIIIVVLLLTIIGTRLVSKYIMIPNRPFTDNFMLFVGLALSGAGVGLGIFIILNFNNIKIVIGIFKATGQFVAENPWLIIFTVGKMIFDVFYQCLWYMMLIWLFTIGDKVATDHNPYGSIQAPTYIETLKVYILFFGGWVQFTILQSLYMLNIMATALWYFKPLVADLPIIQTSLSWTYLYHLGSAAFGATFLLLVRVLGWFLCRNEDNEKTLCGKFCCCCCQCIDVIIQHMTKHAYGQIALSGKDFCEAAGDSFKLCMRNAIITGSVMSLRAVLIFLGKVVIFLIPLIVGIFWISSNNWGIENPILAYVALFLIAYTVSSGFMTVWTAGTDGMIQMYCVDEELFGGSKYCLLYTSPSPRDRQKSRMPSSA